ncbi:LysM domain-containing protein [Streptomyces indicus]|uniref:LysM domain-containing protein n=2 Tax=Streptomyces indicus TaxID=417292 RepID=A0A1G9K223_9ACTN|nr:LysM domain-containing protein [Streptomyces indicus]
MPGKGLTMAKPLSFEAFLDAMRDEGVTVKVVGDAKHHNRAGHGAWGPVHGVMIHHTVTEGTERSVALCRTGHMTLPGPLCHGVIDKKGVVHVVGYGRANHAGSGDDDVLRAVIAEGKLPPDNEANTDGNSRFYGFECINLGDNRDPWPEAQVEAIVRASAGILRRHGWGKDGPTSVIGHSEWQPGKIDPRGPIGKKGGPALTMDAIRKRVAERLKHPANWSPGGSTGGGTGGSTYTVRKGDTLWSIAQAKLGSGARNAEIAKLNGLKDPSAISIGQKLKIPAK